jgi:hypothetical protein
MSKIRLFVFVACLVAATAVQANDGSIAVYLDDAGTQCEGNLTGISTGSIYMNLAGATAGGITGVEFRVDNSNNSAYSISATPSPEANVALGQPFASYYNPIPGANLAFPTCQTGPRVKLYSLLIQENSSAADVNLTVRQHYQPSNEAYRCPLAVLCDAPVYTLVCIGARESDHWRAVINPSDGVSGDCYPVAVQPTSWSTVKSLYGN